jgi:nicotinic acid phosphoribosyltransferase
MAKQKFLTNAQLLSDAYKYSHPDIYHPGTTSIKSYLESRGGKWTETTFFGLQYYLKNYYTGKVVTKSLVQESKRTISDFFGNINFNKKEYERRWNYIVEKYDGHLPLRIRSVREGTSVPTSNVLMTIQETDPNCYWLTNFVESVLVQTWYGSTVATQSRSMKKTILEFLHKTGTPELIDYFLVDFGLRGVSSIETAGVGGAAHLVNFKATDNIPGYSLAKVFYNAPKDVGSSIPASEHSTITSWKRENELKAMANMLDKYPKGMIACVSDSFDIYRACRDYWGTELKDRILSRDGVLVIRPDCYDENTEILTNTGWKFFKDIDLNTKVATYHNENITFDFPEKYIKQPYSGNMIKFYSEKMGVDLLVTPNHRCYYKNNTCGHNNEIQVEEAEKLSYYHNKNFLVSGNLINKNPKIFSAEDRFNIAFQADGCFDSGNTEGSPLQNGLYKTRFQFKKQRKTDRLINICETGNYEYKISYEECRKGQTTIYVYTKFKPQKTFNWVKNILEEINCNYCQSFIEECSYWDASRRKSNKFKYDSCIRENSEIIQLLCCLSGYRGKLSTFIDKRKSHFSDTHNVAIFKSDVIGGQAIKKTTENYVGDVYCVKVKSGAIVVRRNNRIAVSGNSGNPLEVLPVLLEILGEKFGFVVNTKGYKVLNPKVRLIQGDGIDHDSLREILECITNAGWSADNLAFGSGGGLLQKVNRDTSKYAFKCSQAIIDGEEIEVYKDPITDPGKTSKRGVLKLIIENGQYKTVNANDPGDDQLVTVFENGKLLVDQTFAEIRELAKVA